MDFSSWFRRNLTRSSENSKTPNPQTKSNPKGEDEEQFYGITEPLINYAKSFTFDIFKNFPLQDEEESTFGGEAPRTSANVRKDLSEWQERHASLLLSKVKEISQLRYMLCPRHLKERQFWGIYFKLVKSYVVEYELRAIQLEKLRKMAMENEESSDSSNSWEVEMAETKPQAVPEHPTL
ncbi:BSD domain containing protein [Quillaja saponaria]|uniref:BSD domain containing protein n=1 Tax=Quillaja saponaria TaxID=32244 RepID=A0AAD7L2T3_QUISA|nr:BSD domain containing protein [Quillaja saponaria]